MSVLPAADWVGPATAGPAAAGADDADGVPDG
jgi:hypothetical protein